MAEAPLNMMANSSPYQSKTPVNRWLKIGALLGLLGMASPLVAAPQSQLAAPETLAETVSDTLRVREGYRFEDPLFAETPGAEVALPGLPMPQGRSSGEGDSRSAGDARHLGAAWVSALRVNLIGDRDGDGYYRGFRLDIDVDTDASAADVYAVIYLQRSGSRLQTLHVTRTFTILGTRSSDEYTLDIELLDDYRAGRYDLAIDIIAAYDGRLLDAVSVNEFTSLGGLPLEAPDGIGSCLGAGFDDDYYDEFPDSNDPVCGHAFDYPQHQGAYEVAYAGSTGGGLLLALSCLLFSRRWGHAVYSERAAGHQRRQPPRRRGLTCRVIRKRTPDRWVNRKTSG